MALLSVTLHKYFQDKERKEDIITIGLPASFSKKAKSAETLELRNDLCPLFVDLKLESDFDTALDLVKTSSRQLKRSFRPYALYYLNIIMAKLPMSIYIPLTIDTSAKCTMSLSNVAGPREPLIYEGCECTKMAVMAPGIHQSSVSFSVISIGNSMKISVMTDEILCQRPDEILRLFNDTKAQVFAASQV